MEPISDPIFATDDLKENLESAVKDMLEKINYCNDQANLWLARKQKLQETMDETLGNIQKKVVKDKTIADLILSFLEKNGPARTIQVRKFLLEMGRKTSPGVALSRMVQHGVIKNKNRGIYEVV